MRKINTITFFLSNFCNMDCDYCFIGSKKNSLRITFGQLKKIIDWFLKNSYCSRKITFTGGEPLIEFTTIRKIVNYLKYKNILKDTKFVIYTNGTILSNQIINFLKINDIKLIFSIDGSPATHNLSRKLLKERSSFDLIWNNIQKYLRKIEIPMIRMTVVPDRAPFLFDDFQFLFNKGFDRIKIDPALGICWDERSANIFFSQMKKIFKFYLREKIKSKNIFIDPISIIEKQLKNGLLSSLDREACGLGYDIYVSYDGNIYACPYSHHCSRDFRKKLLIGTLKSGVDIDKMTSFSKYDIFTEFGIEKINPYDNIFKRFIHFTFDIKRGGELKKDYIKNMIFMHSKTYEMVINFYKNNKERYENYFGIH